MAVHSTPLPPLLPGLSLEPGLKFQEDVWHSLQMPVSWPDFGPSSFAMVVSFGRCKFKLCPISVAYILQATIGGTASHFRVKCLHNRTFKFFVTSKAVGFSILKLRSFSCELFALFFHLLGNGGPNWRFEFSRFIDEERASWKTVGEPSVLKTSKTFADVVKTAPLSGANLEPIGKPKISKQMRDHLLFPQRNGQPSFIARNPGKVNEHRTLPVHSRPLCPRCLRAGHSRAACHQPICCHACLGWGHIAAFCRTAHPIEQLPKPDSRRQVSSIGAKSKMVAPGGAGLLNGMGTDRPLSAGPPVFESFGDFFKSLSPFSFDRNFIPPRPITVPWDGSCSRPTKDANVPLLAVEPDAWTMHPSSSLLHSPSAATATPENPTLSQARAAPTEGVVQPPLGGDMAF